jgi:hypothetical protein
MEKAQDGWRRGKEVLARQYCGRRLRLRRAAGRFFKKKN